MVHEFRADIPKIFSAGLEVDNHALEYSARQAEAHNAASQAQSGWIRQSASILSLV